MLILTRKHQQGITIRVPGREDVIRVSVQNVLGRGRDARVYVGVEAAADIEVMRDELVEKWTGRGNSV